MATANSTGNLIVFTASGDTARVGVKLRLAGVMCISTSLTAAAAAHLRSGNSGLAILPTTKAASGGGMFAYMGFDPVLEVTGLKATSVANCNIIAHLA